MVLGSRGLTSVITLCYGVGVIWSLDGDWVIGAGLEGAGTGTRD